VSHDVEVEESFAIPLVEVSGLALLTTGGRVRLVAVGDHTPELAVAEVAPDGALGDWSVVDPRTFDGPPEHAPDSQLEAVAADSAGVLLLLAEEPSRVHVVDLDSARIITSFRLDVSPIEELARAWDAEPSSRGEGLLLLADGHLLVAKEKDVPGLIELGPVGDQPYGVTPDTLLGDAAFTIPTGGRLQALAWWPLPGDCGLDDLSELALDAHGTVHLLSDQSASLARLRLPLLPDEPVVVQGLVALPKKARNAGKPEGLAVLPGGRAFLSGDRHDAGHSLVRLAPLPPLS
jgi:hypothetical protein